MGKPTEKKKAGNVQLTVWTNTGAHGEFNSFQIQRVYKEGEEFKYTDSLNETDLGDATALLEYAKQKYRVKDIGKKDLPMEPKPGMPY